MMSSSQASDNSTTSQFWFFLILAALLIVGLAYVYLRLKRKNTGGDTLFSWSTAVMSFFRRGSKSSSSGHESGDGVTNVKAEDSEVSSRLPQMKRPDRPDRPRDALYIPQEIGHRSGTRRVFNTSKGLRVFETNYQDFPMPKVVTVTNSN